MLQRVVGDADLGGHVTAKVGKNYVTDFDEVVKDRSALRGVDIEQDAALIAVERFKK